MTRVWDVSTPGRVIARRASNGYVAMDTARPMPAKIAEVGFTGITVDFPRITGEVLHSEFLSSGAIQYWTTSPTSDTATEQVLGAFTGSALPSFLWGRARFNRTKRGGNVTGYTECTLPLNEWVQWPGGSLLLELFGQSNVPIWMWRHLDISVSNGNWVLTKRHSNGGNTSAKSTSIVSVSTQSTYTLDLTLSWGVNR